MSSTVDTRTRILQACLEMLEKGPAEANVVRVAKLAGLSRQAVYLHFSTKAELLIATARYLDERENLEERIQPMLTARTAEELLDRHAEFLADYNPLIYPVARAVDSARRCDESLQAAWHDRLQNRLRGGLRVGERLAQWNRLDGAWDVPAAARWLTAQGSVKVWEELVVDIGWSQGDYARHLAYSCKKTLLTWHG